MYTVLGHVNSFIQKDIYLFLELNFNTEHFLTFKNEKSFTIARSETFYFTLSIDIQ